VAIFFFATEARKHGIALKDLKKKALVGISALVLWRFIFPLPQNRRASSELSEVAVGEAQWLLQAA
jgi:hypothetical protein